MKPSRNHTNGDRNHKLKRIAKQASKLEEAIDGLLCESEGAAPLQSDGVRTKGGSRGRRRSKSRPPAVPASTTRMILEAAQGIPALGMNGAYDGGAVFIINELEVKLPPKPAALLEILAADDRPSPDLLVGFKPRSEVEERLAKKFGLDPSNDALNNLIYRLRRELEKQAGLNRYYIQIQKHLGLRFALRRNGGSAGSRTRLNPGIVPAAD
ncbi:MAG: hypothetical protein KJ072_11170 [Verrucomicrobia bacterium]|nr:hypothetical protein [Verrucomicrobiota bacterium]